MEEPPSCPTSGSVSMYPKHAQTSNKREYLSSSLALAIHSSSPGSIQWNSSGTISEPAPNICRTVDELIIPIREYIEVFPVVINTSVIPSSPKDNLLSGRLTSKLKAVGVSLFPLTAGQIQVCGLVVMNPFASLPNPAGEYLIQPNLLLNETFLCIKEG